MLGDSSCLHIDMFIRLLVPFTPEQHCPFILDSQFIFLLSRGCGVRLMFIFGLPKSPTTFSHYLSLPSSKEDGL